MCDKIYHFRLGREKVEVNCVSIEQYRSKMEQLVSMEKFINQNLYKYFIFFYNSVGFCIYSKYLIPVIANKLQFWDLPHKRTQHGTFCNCDREGWKHFSISYHIILLCLNLRYTYNVSKQIDSVFPIAVGWAYIFSGLHS